MSGHGRYCEEGSCLCPVHGTPLWYWPKGDLHACQDHTCEYAQEFDLEALRYKEMWESLNRSRRLRTLEWAAQEDVYAAIRKLVEKMRKPSFALPEPVLVHPDEYHLYAPHEGRLARSKEGTMKSELIEQLCHTQSATATLADWVGVDALELGRVQPGDLRRLTAEERELLRPQPGVTQAYHRTAVLYTPSPAHRPVAWVEATVLTHLLPGYLRVRVEDAVEPLGQVLAELPGFVRESVRVSDHYGSDWSGERVGIQSTALLSFGELPLPVALVTENVYQATVDRNL